MRSMAIKFSWDNSWALDSTFGTNQYGLPLYAAIVPNQDGIGVPVFNMLWTKDKEEGHEGIALEDMRALHRFGRLFAYRGIDTTNHVERHWE